MGEVYRAEDTSLGRPVALKFLAAHLLNDDEAEHRFLREAKAAAAISHPNICTVHEVGETEGKTFLAMAYLEGDSLEDKIAEGPLPLKDTLDIGRQIAEGLEAAHEKGIVHRDIKPANVMVDGKGRATILDFGLARLTEASKLTRQNQTVGTVAYMSPEQIQGGEVDHRTDIWALGCVLYEMVAGLRPFKGQYDQALAYEIVQEEPEPLTGVRAGVPMELEFIVSECLAKDREDRTSSAHDVARKLRTLADKLKSGRSTIIQPSQMTGAVTASRTLKSVVAESPGKALRLWQASTAAAILVAATFAVGYFLRPSPEAQRSVRRFSFQQEGVRNFGAVNISPNGRCIAFTAPGEDDSRSVWVRPLDSETARELPGTQGALIPIGGWSPDSGSILFGTTEQLKRVPLDGGEPTVLCTLPGVGIRFTGATYGPSGERIIFGSGARLWEIPARGGQPSLVFEPDESSGEFSFWAPQFLPLDDGRYLTYSAQALVDGEGVRHTGLLDLETGERRTLAPGEYGVYSRPGFLIHGRSEPDLVGLFAMPFSLETLSATGESFPLAPSGRAASISSEGTLVYGDTGSSANRLSILDRSGKVTRLIEDPVQGGASPAISPDGTRVALRADSAIWVYDLDRGVGASLSADLVPRNPTWTSSGEEVVYWEQASFYKIRAADGSSEPSAWSEEYISGPISFSRDGRFAVYVAPAYRPGGGGIWYEETAADGSEADPVPWLVTSAGENQPRISPDSKYLAYRSNMSGRFEVYVQPFPEGEGRWLISTNGGSQPRWSADGEELFYLENETLMAVPVSTEGEFSFGEPSPLFESADLSLGYDVFSDGNRFATVAPGPTAAGTVHIVQNWYEEFRDRE